METRSTRTTLTFLRAFLPPGAETPVPPGDYVLVVEEERLQGVTFEAYRRTAGFLVIGGDPSHPGRTEMLPITEADLARLIDRDRASDDAVPGSTWLVLPPVRG